MKNKRLVIIIVALLVGVIAACFLLPGKIGGDCQKEIDECWDYVKEHDLKCICPMDCSEYENGNPFCGSDSDFPIDGDVL